MCRAHLVSGPVARASHINARKELFAAGSWRTSPMAADTQHSSFSSTGLRRFRFQNEVVTELAAFAVKDEIRIGINVFITDSRKMLNAFLP